MADEVPNDMIYEDESESTGENSRWNKQVHSKGNEKWPAVSKQEGILL